MNLKSKISKYLSIVLTFITFVTIVLFFSLTPLLTALLLSALMMLLVTLVALIFKSETLINEKLEFDEFKIKTSNLNLTINDLTKDIGMAKEAFDIIPLGLLLINDSGKIEWINKIAKNILEVSKVADEKILEHFNVKKVNNAAHLSLSKKIELKEKIEFSHNLKTVELRAIPLIDKNEAVTGCLVTMQDTTKIEALASVKKDFIANVSHDLKTPIASIKSLTEALLAGAKDDKKTLDIFLKDLDQQSERLSDLVRDFLDLSKIESKNTLSLKSVDLNSLVKQTVNIFKHQAEGKKIAITISSTGNTRVRIDSEQLSKAFYNLIDNSLKYSHENSSVLIKLTSNDSGIKISFKDNGIGIPQKDLNRIFERFYRVSKSRSAKTGGTGLGLSIVKHVIENHNGNIKVKSQLNKGTEFIIILPNQLN